MYWRSKEQHTDMYRVEISICLLMISASIQAASISTTVLDTHDHPVEHAIISLIPKDPSHLPAQKAPLKAKMDQWKKQYVPYDLAVQIGTKVNFPNKDQIKHHVYSFSAAKRFELKLYSGLNAKPVLFDKAGVVVLGCNVHDWMLGFIYVLETPYFTKTDKYGQAVIRNLPEDDYIISVWHPRMRGDGNQHDQKISLKGKKKVNNKFKIKLKRERKNRRLPGFDSEEY